MKVEAELLTKVAEDILRVAEDGKIERSDLTDILNKLVVGGYQQTVPELTILELGMALVQVFYNTLVNQKETIQ